MHYFPLLKQRKNFNRSYCYIIAFYGIINNIITLEDIRQGIGIDNGILKILNKYFNNDQNIYIDEFDEIDESEYDKIKNDLVTEYKKSTLLFNYIWSNQFINKAFYMFIKSTESNPYESPSIRLLRNVLKDNTKDMFIALYVDKANFYDCYIYLYNLAVSRISFEIANMLKQIIVIKHFYIREVLNNNFDNVTDLTNTIFKMIII